MEGRSDGRTDGRTGGRTDGLTYGWTDRWTVGRMDGRTDGRTDRRSVGGSGGNRKVLLKSFLQPERGEGLWGVAGDLCALVLTYCSANDDTDP